MHPLRERNTLDGNSIGRFEEYGRNEEGTFKAKRHENTGRRMETRIAALKETSN